MIKKKTVFDRFNVLLMIIFCLIIITPFWYIIVGSLNEGRDFIKGNVFLFPRKLTFSNYRIVFLSDKIYSAYWVTIKRTIIGTFTSVLFTTLFSYGISRKNLAFKKLYHVIVLVPMFVAGGLIPQYMLYNSLGILNTFSVYIIPGLLNVWNMIIIRSYIVNIGEAIIESARIDGAGEYRIFFRIILPLSKPVIAAIVLFVGVGHWNSYFDSLIFTSSPKLQTLQIILRGIIMDVSAAKAMGNGVDLMPAVMKKTNPETLKFATMIVATGPILLIYPMLQKYFIKGVMIGSIKG